MKFEGKGKTRTGYSIFFYMDNNICFDAASGGGPGALPTLSKSITLQDGSMHVN